MNTELVYGVVALIVSFAAFFFGYMWRSLTDKKYAAKLEKEAQKDAEVIIDKAQKEAELQKKTAILEAKDEWFKAKSKYDEEVAVQKEKMNEERQSIKDRIRSVKEKEDQLQKRENDFNAREGFLNNKEKSLRTKDAELTRLIQVQNEKLERIAHMTKEEAKKTLLENLESDIRYENAQLIKDRKEEAKEEAEREAREITLRAIQSCAADTTVESTVSVVHLPSDEMKGRIIGREGRNIRAFEEAAGIDVIVDDTPEAVILSSFDPIRREVARMALEKLVSDGRIHPGRIEDLIVKSREELDKKMKEAAEEVLYDLRINGIKPKLIEQLGHLKYRTSYGQNVLQHSKEVAILSGIIAAELGFDQKTAVRAGLLHDIGKAIDREQEGTHSELGAKLAEKYGENEIICNAIAAHHEDVTAISMFPVIVQAADTVSSTRPGVRNETLSNYVNRLSNLEEIADSFKGVSKSYVIQAGREIRVMVEPEEITDAQAEEMSNQLAQKIEAEMEYPGQIKVTTIRETRFTEYAK